MKKTKKNEIGIDMGNGNVKVYNLDELPLGYYDPETGFRYDHVDNLYPSDGKIPVTDDDGEEHMVDFGEVMGMFIEHEESIIKSEKELRRKVDNYIANSPKSKKK